MADVENLLLVKVGLELEENRHLTGTVYVASVVTSINVVVTEVYCHRSADSRSTEGVKVLITTDLTSWSGTYFYVSMYNVSSDVSTVVNVDNSTTQNSFMGSSHDPYSNYVVMVSAVVVGHVI